MLALPHSGRARRRRTGRGCCTGSTQWRPWRPRRAPDRAPRGRPGPRRGTMPGWPAARSPGRRPLPAGAPWRPLPPAAPSAAGGPRRRRRRGRRGWSSSSSPWSRRGRPARRRRSRARQPRSPAPQAPPVVVAARTSPEDDGASSRCPASPRAAAAPPAAVAESVDGHRAGQVPVGRLQGSRRPRRPGPRPASRLRRQPRRPGADRRRHHHQRGARDHPDPRRAAAVRRLLPDGARAYVSVFGEQNTAQTRRSTGCRGRHAPRRGRRLDPGRHPALARRSPRTPRSEVVPNHDAASISIIDTATTWSRRRRRWPRTRTG